MQRQSNEKNGLSVNCSLTGFWFERLTAVKNSVKKNGPKNEKNFDKTRYNYKNSIWTQNINMISHFK